MWLLAGTSVCVNERDWRPDFYLLPGAAIGAAGRGARWDIALALFESSLAYLGIFPFPFVQSFSYLPLRTSVL